MRREALSATTLAPLPCAEISDEEIERAASRHVVSPRSVVRALAGLDVRGAAGERARRAAAALRSGERVETNAPTATLPISEWIVIFEGAPPVFVRTPGTTRIGAAGGWSCAALLRSERQAEQRVDVLTLTCTKGDVEIRTDGRVAENEPEPEHAPLQISEGGKPVATIAFAGRRVA